MEIGMEQKIREYLNEIADKGVIAPFDVEQILSDIMRIVKPVCPICGEYLICKTGEEVKNIIEKCNCGKPYDYTEDDRS